MIGETCSICLFFGLKRKKRKSKPDVVKADLILIVNRFRLRRDALQNKTHGRHRVLSSFLSEAVEKKDLGSGAAFCGKRQLLHLDSTTIKQDLYDLKSNRL